VYIIQLLPQHGLTFNDLRMASFFPKLVSGLRFVRAFEKFEQAQQLRRIPALQIRQDLFGGIGLEPLNISAQVLGAGDQMKVVFQDHIAEYREAVVLLKKSPGVQNDIHGFRAGEYRQPVVDGCRQKMRVLVVQNLIAAAGHWSFLRSSEAGASGTRFPSRSLGTSKKSHLEHRLIQTPGETKRQRY
jgi:hypothetical protein